jgi:exodeoxyribonuclease V alpha subunit
MQQDLGDFYVKITSQPIPTLKQMIGSLLETGTNYRHIGNQIIVPSKKSFVGTKALNVLLQQMLNPSPEQTLELPRYDWDKDRVVIGLGDKVVCTENCYDLRDYFERYAEWDQDMRPISHSYIPCPETKQMLNGETGVVTQMYPDGSFDVDFGDRIVEIPAVMSEYWDKRDTVIDNYPARTIDLAYALTTHKCQGSEFENVIYLINKSMMMALSRQNFYTAVTRAKKRVTIITDQTALNISLRKIAQ